MTRKIWKTSVAVMGLAAWLLLWLAYPGHLHEAEGNSIFLYTWTFAADSFRYLGGLSNYLGDFVVQFFYWPWLGAALVAALLAAFALGIGRFIRSDAYLPLSILPPAAYLALMMDGNWTVAGLIGLCAGIWAAVALASVRKGWVKAACAPLLAAVLACCCLTAKFYIYNEAEYTPWIILIAGTAAIVLIGRYLPDIKVLNAEKGKPFKTALVILLFVAALGAGSAAVAKRYNAIDEEIYRYTYLVRTADWDGVLELAARGDIKSPVSTSALNLALEMKGRLGDDMFKYFQSGQRSLINFEERKISTEVLFYLGFVNEASHLAFEDMAANPARSRGVYHLTRLARFSAVDSTDVKLNARYLATLDKTLFYRHFDASGPVSMAMQPSGDFFFDYGNFQNMLWQLYSQCPDNGRVYDYLAASLLLTKNLQAFDALIAGRTELPQAHEEAAQVIAGLKGEQPTEQLQKYVSAYESTRGNASRMKRWEKTYWYYYNFR